MTRRHIFCSLLLVLLGRSAAAQDVSGTISGAVVDETNQVLPGASVTLLNEQTHLSRSLVTDGRGEFRFVSVDPGPYTVRVELTGFQTLERRHNILSASDRLSVGTLRLKVGGLAEAVTVEASGAKVNPEESQPTGLLTATQIAEIQTKGRDVANLLRLLPGVRYADDVEALGESFGTELPNVGGQRKHWNHVSIDGVMGNEIGGSNRVAQQVNLDAIEEVKVLLNTYRAEYGRGGGAYIQIVSKSGGSSYRGSAYYYGRHEKLNANGFFDNMRGIPRGHYRYNTLGFNLGGPIRIPGLWEQSGDKKLFFQYSMEAPLNERPGTQRNFRMPTDLERRGDFSQSGVIINDPLTGLPFPGNVIPSNRINPSGQAILGLFPAPNYLVNTARENHVARHQTDNPRLNNILRLDWKPSRSDSFFASVKDWYSDQRGVDITVGPSRWGLFDAHYKVTDRTLAVGHTHFFGSNLINEVNAGVRRQTEEFFPVTDADWDKLRRSTVGFTVGQLHPELNPQGIIPKIFFGSAVGTGSGAADDREPNIWFDNRLVDNGSAWYHSFRDNLTWIKGRHTMKGGIYLEHVFNTEGKGGSWMGEFDFRNTRDNPLDACQGTVPSGASPAPCGFANALLGVFREYRESDNYSFAKGHGWEAEWYLQDTWKTSRRLTVDYGMRFLWYAPWYQSDGRAAVFVPERYDPAKAPRLYYPTRINGQNFAIDRATGELKPELYVGTFVPGSGDFANGMVLATDPSYPRGFRENQGVHPEPRVGLAYDLFGNARTVLHLSGGLYHYARIGNGSINDMAGNPPIVNSPSVFYGTFDQMASLRGISRPVNVRGLERDAQTSSAYTWALGIQRDVGWGTVVDLTYAGSVNRHLSQVVYLNRVPDGAKLLDLHPENVDPRNGRVLPDVFLRPITQYGEITARQDWGTQNYNALQVQINRRYTKGLQFSVAYTFSKALGIANEDDQVVFPERGVRKFYYAPNEYSQTHNLVVNYTWDLPKASKLVKGGFVRAVFDNWQLSGENALVSGNWDQVVLRRLDGSDAEAFFGSTSEGGRERRFRPILIGDPQAGPHTFEQWFNTAAFARPTDRFDYGNTPRNVFQLPGIDNWNLSFFKNVPMGGRRRLQLRWEMYNVLNHTQFKTVNHDAEFDAAGNQTNINFGKVTAARNPRIMQGSIRMNF
ncbi:MAG TPA: carboxypeptidase regulatory-like domain-containing protein [Vicinamibacteria bacterium]